MSMRDWSSVKKTFELTGQQQSLSYEAVCVAAAAQEELGVLRLVLDKTSDEVGRASLMGRIRSIEKVLGLN